MSNPPYSPRDITQNVYDDINKAIRTTLGTNGNNIDIQNPLPTDGDSVYCKDIDTDNSDIGDFSGEICDLFNSLKTLITNTTSDNPKILKIWFQRTIYAHEIGLGCDDLLQGFGTDITVKFLGSGEAVRTTKNFTGLDPNSALLQFEPLAFNGLILEFNTANQICLSNMTIRKAVETTSFIKIQKPDGTIITAQGTQSGNFKTSIEEFEDQVSVNGNTQLKTTSFHEDGTEGVLISGIDYKTGKSGIDRATETLQNIDYEHHEIHAGSHYFICDYELGKASGSVIEFVLTTPNTDKWMHMTLEFSGSEGATLEVFKNTTGVVGGTIITPVNNNGNSTNTSDLIIVKDPSSIASDGTRAAGFLAGGGRTSGFNQRGREIVLQQNTTFLFRFTSLANSNDIGFCGEWYEHTNKN